MMKRVMGKVNLKDWNLEGFDDAVEECEAIIRRYAEQTAAEALECMLRDDELTFYFPRTGDKNSDPLAIRLAMGLAEGGGDVVIEGNLAESLFRTVRWELEDDGEVSIDHKAVVDALRTLADDVEIMAGWKK